MLLHVIGVPRLGRFHHCQRIDGSVGRIDRCRLHAKSQFAQCQHLAQHKCHRERRVGAEQINQGARRLRAGLAGMADFRHAIFALHFTMQPALLLSDSFRALFCAGPAAARGIIHLQSQFPAALSSFVMYI